FVFAPSGSYRIIRDADTDYFLFEKYTAGELAISYKFSLAETDDRILYRAKELTESHKSSKFNKGLLLTLTTPEGPLTATDQTFKGIMNEEKEKESIDQHQLFSISRTFFDINLVELGYSGNEV